MKKTASGPSQRQLRVGEQIRHIIAETLQRGHFHEETLLEAGKVTVTEVRMTPDLRHADIYVLSLGGEDMEAIIPALNESAQYFQKEINRKSQLKFTPKVKFRHDSSFENAQRLDQILSNLHYSDEE